MNYTFKTDLCENRLYVKIVGSLNADDVEEYLRKFNREFDKLKSGMTVLFDLREAKANAPEAASKMESNKQRAIDKGLNKAAIILDSVILKGQCKRSYNKDKDVEDAFFDNMEDAIEYLNA